MLCGAVLRQVLDSNTPGKPLVIGNCTIAMELEALKLLRRGRPEQLPTPVDIVLSRGAPQETQTLARFLHQEVDAAAQHYPIRSIVPGPLRVEDVDPGAAMLFLNHARQGIADGPAALRAAVEHHRRTGMTVLVLLRTCEQAPLRGLAVDGTPLELPAHYALLDAIAGEGGSGAHAFVEGFDRDFLVPPNDGCGLGIILLSRDAAHLDLPGLQRFPGPLATGRRELVSWGGAARHNYALALDWALPEIAGTPEWDWQAFRREHDDTLSTEALARQPSRAAGTLLASFAYTLTEERRRDFARHEEAVSTVRQLCESGELPWSGAQMLAHFITNQNGDSALAWRAVAMALFDLGCYGIPAEAAFRRIERMFGNFLLKLRDPKVGLEVAESLRDTAAGAYATTQLAALRAICALRSDAPEQLLMAAYDLLPDTDWAPAAELMITYARHRMVGRSPLPGLAAQIGERTLSARERDLLKVMEVISQSPRSSASTGVLL